MSLGAEQAFGTESKKHRLFVFTEQYSVILAAVGWTVHALHAVPDSWL